MPNRIIKESLFSSEKISELSDFNFRLWIGLITQADDYGRGDARPAIIKGRVFPLRERVRLQDIEDGLATLAAGSCVSLYEVGGKPYYQFPNWQDHQRVRNAKPKFPPPGASNDRDFLRDCADDNDSPQLAATRREAPPNPIQSESNPNPIQSSSSAHTRDENDDHISLERYASANLQCMSPRNIEELVGFLEILPEDVIMYAIDEACAHGTRQFAYVRKTLQAYLRSGLNTLGDVKAHETKYTAANSKAQKPEPVRRKVKELL